MSNSDDLKKHYDLLSRFYDLSDWFLENFRYKKLRPMVWSHASGKTLDLGVGTGLNIPHYPSHLQNIVGVDLSEGMLERAQRRAKLLGSPVELLQMDATALKFPERSFDTIVSTFLFCVLPNALQPQALSECWRVLSPNGRLVLLEYAFSKNPLRKFFMKLIAPYVRLVYRAGFDRKTLEFIQQEPRWRFEEDRFIHKDIIRLIIVQKI